MSVLRRLTIVFVSSLIVFTFAHLKASTQEANSSELKLTLSSAKSVVKRSDQFNIAVMIENTGQREIFISNRLRWNYLGNLMFFITDPQGHEVESKLIPDEPPGPPPLDVSDYIKLRPGNFFGSRYFAPIKDMKLNLGNTKLQFSIAVSSRRETSNYPLFLEKTGEFWSQILLT